jgi:hypothetical protein
MLISNIFGVRVITASPGAQLLLGAGPGPQAAAVRYAGTVHCHGPARSTCICHCFRMWQLTGCITTSLVQHEATFWFTAELLQRCPIVGTTAEQPDGWPGLSRIRPNNTVLATTNKHESPATNRLEPSDSRPCMCMVACWPPQGEQACQDKCVPACIWSQCFAAAAAAQQPCLHRCQAAAAHGVLCHIAGRTARKVHIVQDSLIYVHPLHTVRPAM